MEVSAENTATTHTRDRCGALEERFPEYKKVMYFW